MAREVVWTDPAWDDLEAAAELTNFTQWCRQSRHVPLRELFPLLKLKLRGYYNYYGAAGNSGGLKEFFNEAMGSLWKWLNRRSQRRSFTRQGFADLLEHFQAPRPRIKVQPRDPLRTAPAS